MVNEMADNAMIIHENGAALSVYQERDDVRELEDRLMAMHPAAGEVGREGMRAAAQLALLLGANPLPGVNEVHIWKQSGKACMSLGINYWRRKANEWGGLVYEVQPRPMKAAELTEYNIPAGTMAAICKGCRIEDMLRFRAAGFTTREIWDMAGRTGVGTQGANEHPKAGRPNIWTSIKRAETDMLKQLFPAEFGNVERQTIQSAAPIVTVIEADEDGPTAARPYSADDFNADFGMGVNMRAAIEYDDPEEAEYESQPTGPNAAAVAIQSEPLPVYEAVPVYVDGIEVHKNLWPLYDEYLAANKGHAPENVAHLMKWKAQREKEAGQQGKSIHAVEIEGARQQVKAAAAQPALAIDNTDEAKAASDTAAGMFD